jgi:lipopolysaccharide/colanic/teichoic acid biosynthesis glycosyltransferase
MRHFAPSAPQRAGDWLVRRRWQYATSLIVAIVFPLVFRWLLPGDYLPSATSHSALANALAVTLAFHARLSIEPYPGIRQSTVIFPTAAAAHGLVLACFFFTRLPYDRVGFLLGFVLHVVWAYGIYFVLQRRRRLSIAVVPIGDYQRLQAIESVLWVPLARSSLDLAHHCDAIVADFSADLPPEWEAFLADAALEGVIVYQVKPLEESLTGRVQVKHLSENNFGSLVPARGYFHFKAVLDWLLAAAALPFVLPVMLGAAIAIRLEDGGPVFFRQQRIGHRGQPITVLKFRSMHTGAGPADPMAAALTGRLDPRITRVGHMLRRTRIDELPQIWNILKGEMSWIGPRPEAAVLSAFYAGDIPFYRYRHVVKPGISGWAQVNQGHVVDLQDIDRKLQYDFYYIKYFSPWLDLLIVFKTLRTMANGFGAR